MPADTPHPAALLVVEDARITYAGGVQAVRGMSFAVAPGECLALVGESGCGKTTVTRAILGLLPRTAEVRGSIRFAGRELRGASERIMREVRGRQIGLVWQDPFDTLNPLHSVGVHIGEAWRAHGDRPPAGAIAERLAELGIPDPDERMRRYPHQWSGGMLQRAAIAAAAAYRPRLIIADEPTSALDADRAEATLKAIRATGSAVILVSHDLGLVGRHADRVAVCYAGRIVEIGPARDVTGRPRHPYSIGLLASLPSEVGVLPKAMPGGPPSQRDEIVGCAFQPRCARRMDGCATHQPELVDGLACPVVAAAPVAAALDTKPRRRSTSSDVLIEAKGVTKMYGRGHGAVQAVANTDFTLRRGEIVGISGPSGCGKSTLLRLLAMIERPSGGAITVADPSGRQVTERPKGFAMAIFQDAAGSLDARWPVWRSVAEPLTARGLTSGKERRRIARERLAEVGLGHIDPEARPGELSVGQCQRVAIARALVAEPAFLAADEPTSALDAPVAASILGLLSAIAAKGTGVVVVSHDQALLAAFCDRVLTMRDGALL